MIRKLKESAFDGRRFGASKRIAKKRSINEGYFEQDYDDDIREKANELGFSGMSGEDFPFYTNSQGIVPQYDLGDLFDWTAQVELPDDPYKLEIYIGVLMDRYRLPEFRYSANGFEYTDYLDEAIGELKYNYIIDDAGIEDAEYNEMVERGIAELERIVEDYTDRVYDLVDFVKQAQLDLIESQEEYDESLKRKNRRSMREARHVKEGYYDSDEEYTVNGHWLASATYADGTAVEKEFPYTAENYREEQEEQYRLEAWLQNYHPDCTWYSVSFVEDW